jgi:tRNA threonylcarbamoyladenosine biosynthesis protein TsaB
LIVLGLDTCLDACSVAILDDARVLAWRSEPMRRGHQERLGGMTAAVMDEAGLAFPRLDRIGATLGPGSFTGLRVGLAFAKGLALALERPAVGIGVLEALAAEADDDVVAAVIDARRGQVYLQVFAQGRPLMAPDILPLETAAARLAEFAGGGPVALVGPGAALLAEVLPRARLIERQAADPVVVARLAGRARAPFPPLRPLYLRAPDARASAA